MLFAAQLLSILRFCSPVSLTTSLAEFPPSKWFLFNLSGILDQQYDSDSHLWTDRNPSDCGFPDQLHFCTIQLPSVILCSSISILLAFADANRELLHTQVMIAGVIHVLDP